MFDCDFQIYLIRIYLLQLILVSFVVDFLELFLVVDYVLLFR